MSNDANYAVPEEGIDTNIKRKDVSLFIWIINQYIHLLPMILVLVVFVYFV